MFPSEIVDLSRSPCKQSLIKPKCKAHEFYEALRTGLQVPQIAVLRFHTFTDHASLTFLSHLSSLLLFLKKIIKKHDSRNKSQKCFPNENKCMYRDETLKKQPNKMGMTPQHIHTISTSCAILPTMHNKKHSTHSLNEHSTQYCSLRSLLHKSKSVSTTFSSNKIS